MSKPKPRNENPEAIPHEAISASAGSGKTFQLAHRYIRLLSCGFAPDRIIALTFSRKAAGEIFDSIVNHLRLAAETDAGARTAAERIERDGDRRHFLNLLRRFLSNLHRIHVGTLDSFLVGIVRAFPTELGIGMDPEVMDTGGAAAQDLRRDVLGRMFDPHGLTTPDQRLFLEAFKQATFGQEDKGIEDRLTRFIDDYRSQYQVLPESGFWGDPDRIWPDGCHWLKTVESPAGAAAEARAALANSTLPAALLTSLNRIIDVAGRFDETSRWEASLDGNKVFTELLDHIDALRAGAGVVTYRNREYAFTPAQSAAIYPALRHLIGVELRRGLRQTQGIFRVLQEFERRYDSVMRRAGKLTFDDAQYLLTAANLCSGGALLSRQQGEAHRLYIDYRLDCKLDHWLLDEFQDTSDLQWAALGNLADEILQDASGGRSFFYVGDVKQAIYGWRGGNARLFGALLDAYGTRIRRRPLNVSFRSCQPVIDTVNRVFGRLGPVELPAGAVSLMGQFWEEHRCREGVAPARGYAALLEPETRQPGEPPDSEDRYRAAARLLRMIEPQRRGLSTALLVRSNDAGKALVDRLRSECPGMTIVHEGTSSIKDNPVVALLLSLVKLASHPADMFAWRHLQMSPLHSWIARQALTRDSLSIELLREIQASGFQSLVRTWGEHLDSVAPLDPYGHKRLNDLAGAAAEFDLNGSRDGGAFLRFIDAYATRETAPADSVRVMTVHQSKGLGFDVVVLPDLMGRSLTSAGQVDFSVGRDPLTNAPRWALKMPRRVIARCDPVLARELQRADENACFEALCVLYVALTRARKALYMITSFPGKTSTALTAAALLKRQLTGSAQVQDGPRLSVSGEELVCLYERGDREWFARETESAPPLPPEAEAALPAEFRARPSRRTRLIRMEPSGQEDSTRRAGWLFNAESRDVLDFGRAIHEMFQRVTWLDEGDPSALAAEWSRASGYSAAVRRDACRQFVRTLRADAVRNALRRPDSTSGSWTLWREKRFEIVMEERLITGIFDRVVIRRCLAGQPVDAVILDYKSDRVESEADIHRATAVYTPQMTLYRRALARILAVPETDIRLQLLFTRPARLIDLPSESRAESLS